MEVRIRHGQGKQSQAYARFHRVVCDQPFDEGGMDSGMTPPELLLSALGCCAMYYAAEFLQTRGQRVDNIEVKVSAEKGGKPPRLAEIGIEVDAPGLNDRTREGLLRAVEACLLHRTLMNAPKVNINLSETLAEEPANMVS